MLKKVPDWLKNKYTIAFLSFAIWVSFFDQNNFFNQYNFFKELRVLQKDKDYFVKELTKTRQELYDLTSNPVTLEKFAREKYFMKKDNEEIFVFEIK